jgi:DNA replication protein DnaC
LEVLQQKMDIILIGNPGVRKSSFLAKGIAYMWRIRPASKTLFTSTKDLLNHLIAAEADHPLLKKLHY